MLFRRDSANRHGAPHATPSLLTRLDPPPSGNRHPSESLFYRLSLRAKITIFAIAVAVLPLLGTGIVQIVQSNPAATVNNGRNNGGRLTQPANDARTSIQPLLLTYLGVTGVTILLVGAMAEFLTQRVIRSVLVASGTIRNLGQGRLDTRLVVEGQDEIAVLGNNINWMADQLQTWLQRQSTETERIRLLQEITLKLAHPPQKEEDENLSAVIELIRRILMCDRVLIYRFDEAEAIPLVAESADAAWLRVMHTEIGGAWFTEHDIEQYLPGYVQVIPDIIEADFTTQQIERLNAMSVKASLTTPIWGGNRQLLGVLVAHQCSGAYAWHNIEVNLCSHFALQIGLAWERSLHETERSQLLEQTEIVVQQQSYQQQRLRSQLVELAQMIESAAGGDLTVRIPPATGDLSEIARAFNSTLESLQQRVAQVQRLATRLNTSLRVDDGAVHQLADIVLQQTENLTRIPRIVEHLRRSVQTTTDQTVQISDVPRIVLQTAEAGEQVVNHTEQNLLTWRKAASAIAREVNRLDTAYQEIAKVTTLINHLNLQIDVLAVNASLEATHVGQIGHGFARVATEVGELAHRSAAAIEELEKLTDNLQLEIGDVARRIQQNIPVTDTGSDLVEVSHHQMEQAQALSHQIEQLVQSISHATDSQTQIAQSVLDLMQNLSLGSDQISDATHQVAQSLQQRAAISQQLQESVNAFKLDREN